MPDDEKKTWQRRNDSLESTFTTIPVEIKKSLETTIITTEIPASSSTAQPMPTVTGGDKAGKKR